jgi:hypothetical protein
MGREMTQKPKNYHSCFVSAILHRAPAGVFACVLDGMVEQIKLQSLKNPWYHLVVVAVKIAGIEVKEKYFAEHSFCRLARTVCLLIDLLIPACCSRSRPSVTLALWALARNAWVHLQYGRFKSVFVRSLHELQGREGLTCCAPVPPNWPWVYGLYISPPPNICGAWP